MYFVCTDKSEPIAHATLELALTTLRSELRAREAQGFVVSLNDKLEFELCRSEAKGGIDGAPYRMWVEDETGNKVTSKDAAEGG